MGNREHGYTGENEREGGRLLSEITVVRRYDGIALFTVNKQRRRREGSSF